MIVLEPGVRLLTPTRNQDYQLIKSTFELRLRIVYHRGHANVPSSLSLFLYPTTEHRSPLTEDKISGHVVTTLWCLKLFCKPITYKFPETPRLSGDERDPAVPHAGLLLVDARRAERVQWRHHFVV